MLTGDYNYTGETIVYGIQTVYFTADSVSKKQNINLDMDSAITLYDNISIQLVIHFNLQTGIHLNIITKYLKQVEK